MTEKTEDLIAEAREWPRAGVNEGWLINALADALEAVTRERDAATEVLDAHRCDESAERAYKRTIRAEAERDAALARVEELAAGMERCEGLKAAHMRSDHRIPGALLSEV